MSPMSLAYVFDYSEATNVAPPLQRLSPFLLGFELGFAVFEVCLD